MPPQTCDDSADTADAVITNPFSKYITAKKAHKTHTPIVPDLMPISGAVLCVLQLLWCVAGLGIAPVYGPRMPYSIVTYCVSYGLRSAADSILHNISPLGARQHT